MRFKIRNGGISIEKGVESSFATLCFHSCGIIYFQGYGYRPVYQEGNTLYTCSNLNRVTCYNFRLAASNEKGQSQMSPSVKFKTLSSIPGPPPKPYLKDRPLAHSLNITWQEPPDNGGSEIQTYVLQLSKEFSGKGVASELEDLYSGPDKVYRAEGLLPGRKYEARVRGRVWEVFLVC